MGRNQWDDGSDFEALECDDYVQADVEIQFDREVIARLDGADS